MYAFVPDPSNTIAARFKAARINAGHCLKRIATECCVELKTVERWERQGGVPAEALLVCAGMGMDPAFVITGRASIFGGITDRARSAAEMAVFDALGGTDEALLISRGYRAEIH